MCKAQCRPASGDVAGIRMVLLLFSCRPRRITGCLVLRKEGVVTADKAMFNMVEYDTTGNKDHWDNVIDKDIENGGTVV